jgi:hypothetical protein
VEGIQMAQERWLAVVNTVMGYVATVLVYYLVVVKTLLNKRNTNLNAMDD